MPHRTRKSATKFGLKTKSLDEANRLLSGVFAPIVVLPTGPAFDLEISGVMWRGGITYRVSSTSGFSLESECGFDGYSLAVPLSGGVAIKTTGQRSAVKHSIGKPLVINGTETKAARFLPDLRFKGLFINSDLLHTCLAQMCEASMSRRIHFAPLQDSGMGAAQFMLLLADTLFSGMEGTAPLATAHQAVNSLKDTIAQMTLYGLPNNYSDLLDAVTRPAPAPRNVKRAIEYMKAHAGESISLADIARAADTSPRSLQDGFRRFRSTTPSIYLRGLRLYGVHGDLLNPDKPASVAQIAMNWGFTHMGMFASYYRAIFGESPRHTLARRVGVS